ncbi:nitroreductase family protein [Pseudomonas sp. Z3-6]
MRWKSGRPPIRIRSRCTSTPPDTVGHIGGRQWAARNTIFAAQTLMLGAAAKRIDTCPMEGFSAAQVAKLLDLPRASVVPLVIALGDRVDDARVEEQWRRAIADIVVLH